MVALPGLAGSQVPTRSASLDAAAFRSADDLAMTSGSAPRVEPLDPAYRSANAIDEDERFIEPGIDHRVPSRAVVRQPGTKAVSVQKPARYTLTGEATFYDHGTTAMRLPRGTRVVICGAGGCIERVVNDYGPQKPSRIVDLYRPDFFAICGCEWFAGVTRVTVYVY